MEAEGRDISIIVTTHNAAATVSRALASALMGEYGSRFEVIVVDDCSTDGTREIVGDFAREYQNLSLLVMPENTGSPSEPRNAGIARASADYVTFLDDDDYIDPCGLMRMVRHARSHGIQYLKGYLRIARGNGLADANRIDGASPDRRTLIRQMIAQQSTNADAVIDRDFLLSSGVRFDGRVRTGEDTLFATAILSKLPAVGYVDDFFHYYCRRAEAGDLSSTQEYGDRALGDHLRVWAGAEENLNQIGLSYCELRLASAVGHSLRSIVSFSRGGISEARFKDFSRFVGEHAACLSGIRLHGRYREIYAAIESGDYERFLRASKRRLLVAQEGAGAAAPALALLSGGYDIRMDDWRDPGARSERAAGEMLNWADFIWCDGTGPSAWYAERKLAHQTLAVRVRGGPDERPHGGIDIASVDAFAVDGYHELCRLREAGIPEGKLFICGIPVSPDGGGEAGGCAGPGCAPGRPGAEYLARHSPESYAAGMAAMLERARLTGS